MSEAVLGQSGTSTSGRPPASSRTVQFPRTRYGFTLFPIASCLSPSPSTSVTRQLRITIPSRLHSHPFPFRPLFFCTGCNYTGSSTPFEFNLYLRLIVIKPIFLTFFLYFFHTLAQPLTCARAHSFVPVIVLASFRHLVVALDVLKLPPRSSGKGMINILSLTVCFFSLERAFSFRSPRSALVFVELLSTTPLPTPFAITLLAL